MPISTILAEAPAPPARWKTCLWLLLLFLTLALLLGVMIGAVEFVRWRQIW